MLNKAASYGYDTVCITDINNTSACLDSIRQAQRNGIRVIPGIDFRNGARQEFVALPKSNKGFEEISTFLSHCLHHDEPVPVVATEFEAAFVIYPFDKVRAHRFFSPKKGFSGNPPPDPLPGGGRILNEHSDFPSGKWVLRPNEFIGIRPHDIPHLRFSPWRHHMDKLVMLPTVSFANQRDFNVHRLLRAMDNNMLLSKLPKSEEGDPRHVLIPKDELLQCYNEFPQIVRNTERMLEQCEVTFEYRTNKNKKCYTGSVEEDMALLRTECEAGLHYRYPHPSAHILQRIEHELQVIAQMDFSAYFLINWDIVRYARRQGYFYVGRGSGANSIVAYLLRITDVDPVELDLYFERFINPYRASPPDFDIDFSWADRDDMTRYIFDRHGREHVALQATYSTFQDKAITRELGKVFGVPGHEIDRLQQHGKNHGLGKYGDLILKYGPYIHNFPSHLSIHASGILISEKPMNAYGATFMPPKGYPTTQFDMITAEDIGLYKFDILSQRGLGKIKDSLRIIRENRGAEVDIHDLDTFKKDEKVKSMLREGRTIGCFYVESPAMRMLLTKLKADHYLGLVAASSIIRPGVAKSGMMREYVLRFQDEQRREAARRQAPELYRILEETYGVMVYQEDVIKVAHYFAGLTLAEADILRRGMSWKFKERSEFHRVRERFFSNCRAKGYTDELITKVWLEVESFANFAFAKGHSASYAVESYQALYLKAYYPLEYMVATLNNGGGFYRPELYIHEARMHGAQVEAPCVNRSELQTTIRGNVITLGFQFIKELEEHTVERLTAVRSERPFTSLADFIDRVPLGMEQMETLVKAGCFRFTGKNKKELLWEMRLLLGGVSKKEVQPRLFLPQPKPYAFPELYTAPREEAFDHIELLGFPLCDPFMLMKQTPSAGVLAAELPRFLGKEVVAYGYLITAKTTHTSKGERMNFGNFLDRRGYFLDTVHFPDVAARYSFSGRGVYRIAGKVTEEFGCYTIEVSEMHREPYIDDPRYSEEQDYKGTHDHSLQNFLR